MIRCKQNNISRQFIRRNPWTVFFLYTTAAYRSRSRKKPVPAFVDFLQIQAQGGTGGHGLPKFGGFGGNGGNVIVEASSTVKTLKQVLQKYPNQMFKGDGGANSSKFHLLGKPGADLKILVPEGILVHQTNGEIVDLNHDGDHCMLAEGGLGGNSKTNFLGLKGKLNVIGLELKLLADVGLVGFPNAGKSTLLKAISRANPKVGAYPFTTISPQLGKVVFEDGRRITVADLPGLIEGAHQNYGMGIKFLRHAERTKLLLFVLDINPFQLSEKYKERSAFEALLLLIKELEEYGHGMLDKPIILTLNKIDSDPRGKLLAPLMDLINNLPDSLSTVSEEVRPTRIVQFDDVITMSAMKRLNMDTVKNRIREVMDEYAERRLEEELLKKQALMLTNEDSQRANEEHLKTTLV